MNTLTVFIITLTTSRMIFPGVPPVLPTPDAPKVTSPPAARTISFDVFSSAKATYLSKAEVHVPEGLKITSPVRLILDLERKTSSETEQPDSTDKFVVKQYWQSAEEVPAGQPRVFMSDEFGSVPRQERSLPDTSYAYWYPSDAQQIAQDASAVGTYVLKTDYCGSAEVTLDSLYDFLAPIDLVGTPKKANLDKPIKITWKSVPRALGYLVTAVGGNSMESITWTSSSDPSAAEDLENRVLTREEVAKLIEKKVLLASYCVSSTIPAGIFKGSSSVFVNVTAFGPDKIEKRDGFESWVIVRSKAGIPIHGINYKPLVEDEEAKTSAK